MATPALRLAACASIAIAFAASPAHADTIYSCAGADGGQILQNTPCAAGSEVWVQKGPAVAAQPRPAAAPEPVRSEADAERRRETAVQDSVAEAPDPPLPDRDAIDAGSLPSAPALGMSQQQVRAILGAPGSVTQEEVVDGKVVTWSYGDSRSVQFNAQGKVVSK